MRYAVLSNPGHNRVYFDAALALSGAELEVALGEGVVDVRINRIGSVPYIVFDREDGLTTREVSIISRLSFFYALFRVEDDYRALYPIEVAEEGFLDSSVSSILKYSGKTNELFTRMMINLAVCSGRFKDEPRIRLLDPVAGKGTTLFEALRLGYDATGIEIGGKTVQEACAFLKKYLETGKYKHTYEKEKRSGKDKSFTAKLHQFAFARTKEGFKSGEGVRHLTMAEGNSMYADKFFKHGNFHCIVGDLPYGVAHGSVTNEKQSSLTRNPSELLKACLPAWHKLLLSGGVITLAWNVHVLPKADIACILERNGFEPLSGGAYDRLEHRVDRSILRDVVVAVKR